MTEQTECCLVAATCTAYPASLWKEVLVSLQVDPLCGSHSGPTVFGQTTLSSDIRDFHAPYQLYHLD